MQPPKHINVVRGSCFNSLQCFAHRAEDGPTKNILIEDLSRDYSCVIAYGPERAYVASRTTIYEKKSNLMPRPTSIVENDGRTI